MLEVTLKVHEISLHGIKEGKLDIFPTGLEIRNIEMSRWSKKWLEGRNETDNGVM